MSVITVRGLVKDYGSLRAIDDVSFEVEAGEVYALLGANGAGKSTTVEILEGHRVRTSGDVEILGYDPSARDRELRDRIGIVLQTSGVEHEFTVREAVNIYASCYARRRPVSDVVGLVGLDHKIDDRVGTLSGGQRRRLDLALGIVGTPELLFLDEPTTGFDPAARRGAWDLVRQLCSGGTTVLLTTHYLDEAEHLADRVGVLAGGRMVAEGTPAQLTSGAGGTTVRFDIPDALEPGDFTSLREALPENAMIDDGHVAFVTSHPTRDVNQVTGWAAARGIELAGFAVARPTLEDAFLRLSSTTAHEDVE